MMPPSPSLPTPLAHKEIAPRPLSRLTYKIMGMNVITLAILAMSFSYISQTRENLISNEISNFEAETRLVASVLGKTLSMNKTTTASLDQTLLNQTLADLNLHEDQQVSLFGGDGRRLAMTGLIPERRTYSEIHNANTNEFVRIAAAIETLLSVNFKLPHFPGAENVLNDDVPKIEQTVDGLKIAAWSAVDGGLILSADTNILIQGKKLATLQLVRRDMQIEETFSRTRIDVLRFAVISFVLTISFSLYLSGLIGHPLRSLAMAAEAFRLNRGRGRDINIPDLSDRNDEIGELSQAMREMADALRKRLTAIERFAADVAHELKNPLTSMKSAVETLSIVKKEEDRTRLIAIILHDLHRMDRLISDISQASRLDAELARDVLTPLDLRNVLDPLIDAKRDPIARNIPAEIDNTQDSANDPIIKIGFDRPMMVMGHAGRLAQVFDNLIANALSFSPVEKQIRITLESRTDRIKIIVDDDGPGIPENRLEKIFDRFYSERPSAEDFGLHSGLGLSIARQIVESHAGTITAENRKDSTGHILGARFVVQLRSAQ